MYVGGIEETGKRRVERIGLRRFFSRYLTGMTGTLDEKEFPFLSLPQELFVVSGTPGFSPRFVLSDTGVL